MLFVSYTCTNVHLYKPAGSFQTIAAGCFFGWANSMGVITALEVQKRNKKRVNVYLDEEFVFSLSLDEAARLHKGQVLSDADVEKLRDQDEVSRAFDSAARFLSYRPRSMHEVRQNLRQKSVPPAAIDAALERLSAHGYLDDRAFAEFWVRERNAFKPLSPKALRFELRKKACPIPSWTRCSPMWTQTKRRIAPPSVSRVACAVLTGGHFTKRCTPFCSVAGSHTPLREASSGA